MGKVNVAFLFFKRWAVKLVKVWVLEPAALLAERFREEMGNFPRGGPPNPMHPSPAGDNGLLRRRYSKNVEG